MSVCECECECVSVSVSVSVIGSVGVRGRCGDQRLGASRVLLRDRASV